MENASQALIIAGAILLAILIIALGMFIFQQARQQITDVTGQLDSHAVDTHNNRITKYTNRRIKGSAVTALFREIISATANEDKPEATMVGFDGAGIKIAKPANADSSAVQGYIQALNKAINTQIKQNGTYELKPFDLDPNNGFIKSVSIEEK